ncbi:MAG: glucosamine-6-phosphate deaminase [Bacteroidetes bacterium]|nr:glucosamine-6-phosphate deaminase [Bacteroidota bacterium]
MKTNTTKVEQLAIEKSGQKLQYSPSEKVGVIVVDNFPSLGKLTALRFLEWVQQNPGGVVSLPTGKTPEHFIRWVTRFVDQWNSPSVREELEEGGITSSEKPDVGSLHFVQIDEFYPIHPKQQNSFYYYVNKYYMHGFGFDRSKALLIDDSKIGLPAGKRMTDVWPDQTVDLSLRYRQPKTREERLQKSVLEDIDQWCAEYEEQIRSLGGIGFFLGGIGPDGHIGFNVRGSDLNSTTRLTATNYETQAAAATDLGGIEVSRNRLVITIGLGTITYNRSCTAIIMAAGEAKAEVVGDAVQKKMHVRHPGTVLQQLPNARFYLTRGAAKLLSERNYELLAAQEVIPDEETERIVVDLAVAKRKRVRELTVKDFESDRFSELLLTRRKESCQQIVDEIDKKLTEKVELGRMPHSNEVFLHTEPHHDDLMLGYLPYIVRHARDASNSHTFLTLTSGFNAVTNSYMLDLLGNLKRFLDDGSFSKLINEGYFNPHDETKRNRDVWQYLDGVAENNLRTRAEGEARRLLRNLVFLFEDDNIQNLKNRIDELANYFNTQYPGKKDLPHIQRLKGMMREWEADCLWGYFGFNGQSILHARLGFYKGDIFTEEPKIERDVLPVLNVLRKVKPTIVGVALDPEASGPDTHYKVLQVMSEALKMYETESGRSDIKVIGYRNIWYRFHPAEANVFIPVSLNMFAILQNSFNNAFGSQRGASFPSYEHDGPFSELAQRIQVRQYQRVKTCLGRQYFNEHPSPLIRATRGLVFAKLMNLQEFYDTCLALRKSTEDL